MFRGEQDEYRWPACENVEPPALAHFDAVEQIKHTFAELVFVIIGVFERIEEKRTIKVIWLKKKHNGSLTYFTEFKWQWTGDWTHTKQVRVNKVALATFE